MRGKVPMKSPTKCTIRAVFLGFAVMSLCSGCGDGTLDPVQKLAQSADRAPFAYNPIFQTLLDKAASQISLAHFLVDSRQASLSLDGARTLALLSIPAESGFSWETEAKTQLQSADSGDAETLFAKRLHFQGIPVQTATVKHISSDYDLDYATGSAPSWLLAGNFSDIHAGTFDLDSAAVLEAAAKNLNFHPWRFGTFQKIYLAQAKSQSLKAAYRVNVSNEKSDLGRGPSFPLEVLVDASTGDVLSQVPLVFHLDGTAHMYRENSVASAGEGKVDIKLTDLIGDGSHLETELFKVLNCSLTEPSEANCPQKATGPGGDYRGIAYEAPEYNEVVSFYAVNRAMGWYRDVMQQPPANGPEWRSGAPGDRSHFGLTGATKLRIFTRAMARTSNNQPTPDNAQYYPAIDGGETAKIVVGTGWEQGQVKGNRALQYLGRDSDVTMHEFGHHIIYRALRVVSAGSQSLNMHEGFADFFTYAITGNNLLGESIFTPGGPLRHGAVQGKISDFLQAPPHIAGEFWSSTLWDCRTALGAWDGHGSLYKFDKIAWDAIDLLKENANYYDAIAALGKSAENFANANGENANDVKTKLFNVFADRGYLEKPDGSGNLPAQTTALATAASSSNGGLQDQAPNGGNESSSSSTKSKSWFCGVVAAEPASAAASTTTGLWLLLLGLGVPLLYSKATAVAQSAVRVKATLRRKLRKPQL